jgi:hypothetical protein
MHIDGEQLSVAFLRNEPRYGKAAWIDAYAMALGRCVTALTPAQCSAAAFEAYEREGSWNNPKVAAGCDALFGPLERS